MPIKKVDHNPLNNIISLHKISSIRFNYLYHSIFMNHYIFFLLKEVYL